ncbi:MAG: permease [Nanobdellota archaeon]
MASSRPSWKSSFRKASTGFTKSLPIIIGVIFLIGLFQTLITKQMILSVFSGSELTNILIGSLSGSVLAGNPITSYVIGGELQNQGVGLLAITAFLVSWTTVGLVQFPAESKILGKRFATYRNISSFILSFIVALVTVLVVGLL